MLLQLEWLGSALCLPVPVGRLGRDLMLPSLGIPLCVSVCVETVPFNDQLQQPRQIGRDLCVDWKHNDVRLFLLLLPPPSGRSVPLPLLPHKEIKIEYLLLLHIFFLTRLRTSGHQLNA